MAKLKLMKKEWFDWFKNTTLDNITAWTEYYYINPDSQHWISNYQLWDEETQIGAVTDTGYFNPGLTNRLSTKFISVLPNTTYFQQGPATSRQGRIAYYDINKNFILYSDSGVAVNGLFTTPANCYFVIITFGISYGTIYNHDICINKSKPSFNGHYEPRIIKIEDILGVIDLGALNWYKTEHQIYGTYFYCYVSGYKIKYEGAFSVKVYRAWCPNYTTVSRNGLANQDKVFCLDGDNNTLQVTQIQLKDSAYTDPAVLKEDLNGVFLIFLKDKSPY